jgi:hypothetical protein
MDAVAVETEGGMDATVLAETEGWMDAVAVAEETEGWMDVSAAETERWEGCGCDSGWDGGGSVSGDCGWDGCGGGGGEGDGWMYKGTNLVIIYNSYRGG